MKGLWWYRLGAPDLLVPVACLGPDFSRGSRESWTSVNLQHRTGTMDGHKLDAKMSNELHTAGAGLWVYAKGT